MESPLRNAKRKNDPEPSKKAGPSVRLEPETARLLKAQTKKLRLTEVRFASAAITYFAETGLDPTAERPKGLHDLGTQMSKQMRASEILNLDIANQLFSLLQGWEKNLYEFLQQQQGATLNYLEQIENNLLRHQVAVESNLIAPLAEQLCRVNLEATTTRGLATQLVVEVAPKPAEMARKSIERYREQKALMDEERDLMLTARTREFIKTNYVPKPIPTPKPQVLAAPGKSPKAGPGTALIAGTAPK